MEKVLQILIVFGLLMLLIWRSIRTREERFRRFSYLRRLRPPLAEGVAARLVAGNFGRAEGENDWLPDDTDAWIWEEESRLLLCYRLDGKLTIYRRSGRSFREMQELSAPMDCTGLAWDPQERTIYLEEDGDWFVYGEE